MLLMLQFSAWTDEEREHFLLAQLTVLGRINSGLLNDTFSVLHVCVCVGGGGSRLMGPSFHRAATALLFLCVQG